MKPFTLIAAVAAISMTTTVALRAEEPNADTVVAKVNGTDITLGQMIALRATLPEPYLQLDDKSLFDGVLQQIIQQTALAATATPTKKDELTLENTRIGYLAGKALETVAEDAVSDDAVKAAYDAKFANAAPAKEYNAAHILVETEDEAKAIKAELDKGANFDTLAKDKSTGPSGPNAGDLGWFSAGMMVKPFEDAVMAMKAGDVSAPVQTEFGWHIIKLKEMRDAAVPTLDASKEEIAGDLRQKAVEARVKEITETAKVEKMIDGIDPAVIKSETILGN